MQSFPIVIALLLFVMAFAVLSFLIAIGESIATAFFSQRAFGLGPVVLRDMRTISTRDADLYFITPFSTRSGRFERVDSERWIFRFAQSFAMTTPFRIKGTIHWHAPLAVIEGRLPLFPTVFTAIWLILWTAGWSSEIIGGIPSWDALRFLLVGWFIGGFVSWLCILLEIRRAHRVIDELEQKLAHATSQVAVSPLPATSVGARG